jgi:hypothetical protein
MSINVPDDPYHIAAFRGALLTLASANNWANDSAHTAKDVAAVWDEIYQEVSDCIMGLMDVRQNTELPCKLEKTEDGETWEEFADLQLCPPRLRQSKGKLQWFDGSAWVDLPNGGDERYDGEATPQWTDPPEGESGACLAAENIVASYVTMLTQVKSGLEAVLTITGIVDIVAGYIGTQTLFPPALFTLNISIAVGSLAALGIGAIDEFLDSDDIDTLKCIINCNASSDGAFTADEFETIQDEVDEQISEAQKLVIGAWLDSYGPVGLTRAAAANGILDGDCDDCGCNDVRIQFKDEGGTVFQTNFVNVGDSVDIPFVPASTGYISVMNVKPGRCIAFTFTGLPYDAPPAHQQKIVDCDNVDHFYEDVDLPATIDSCSAFVLWSTGFNGVLTMNITEVI